MVVLLDMSEYFKFTPIMEAIPSSETSVNTISTRCHIPEDCCLHILLKFIVYKDT
jgi:hypothetical protein